MKHFENFGGNFGFGASKSILFQIISFALASVCSFGNMLLTKQIYEIFCKVLDAKLLARISFLIRRFVRKNQLVFAANAYKVRVQFKENPGCEN